MTVNKQEFLAQLRKGLFGLPQEEMEERIAFYSETIDDRMEEGLSEEAAVAAVGSVDKIVAQIIADTPLTKIAKERMKTKKRLTAWMIVLLALGAPLWFSLGIAAVAVILSFYVSLWSVIVLLWAVFASLVACSVAGIAAGSVFIVDGNTLSGIATIGAGIVCIGLCVFAFYGCKASAKGLLRLTEAVVTGIKNGFIRKEDVQ